jgi:glycosyltransferase involved in cell wall biosynthesis
LRILHLVGGHSDTGGVLSVLRSLQAAASRPGLEHSVWVDRQFRETRSPSLDYWRARFGLAETSSQPRLLGRALLASWEFLRAQDDSYQVIHAHTRGALIVAWLFSLWKRRPVIFTNHNYARWRFLYRWFAKRKRIHTVMLTPAMARYYGIPSDAPRVSLISACFDDRYLADRLAERDNTEPLRLVGVGSLTSWKKWDLVIDALAERPATSGRLELHIFGPVLPFAESERFAAQLRRKVRELGLSDRVFFRGETDDVPGELRRASWFVLPSSNEPCSVALMEALALGLPALVSRSGGSVDLVAPGCGIHFEVGSSEDLGRALDDILNDRVQVHGAADIRRSVAARCASQVALEYEALYRRVADLAAK